jgi:hypothetical protein
MLLEKPAERRLMPLAGGCGADSRDTRIFLIISFQNIYILFRNI